MNWPSLIRPSRMQGIILFLVFFLSEVEVVCAFVVRGSPSWGRYDQTNSLTGGCGVGHQEVSRRYVKNGSEQQTPFFGQVNEEEVKIEKKKEGSGDSSSSTDSVVTLSDVDEDLAELVSDAMRLVDEVSPEDKSQQPPSKKADVDVVAEAEETKKKVPSPPKELPTEEERKLSSRALMDEAAGVVGAGKSDTKTKTGDLPSLDLPTLKPPDFVTDTVQKAKETVDAIRSAPDNAMRKVEETKQSILDTKKAAETKVAETQRAAVETVETIQSIPGEIQRNVDETKAKVDATVQAVQEGVETTQKTVDATVKTIVSIPDEIQKKKDEAVTAYEETRAKVGETVETIKSIPDEIERKKEQAKVAYDEAVQVAENVATTAQSFASVVQETAVSAKNMIDEAQRSAVANTIEDDARKKKLKEDEELRQKKKNKSWFSF